MAENHQGRLKTANRRPDGGARAGSPAGVL